MIIFQVLGFFLTIVFFLIFHVNLGMYIFNKISFSKLKETAQTNKSSSVLSPFDVIRIFDTMTINNSYSSSVSDMNEMILFHRKLKRRIKIYGLLTSLFFAATLIAISTS